MAPTWIFAAFKSVAFFSICVYNTPVLASFLLISFFEYVGFVTAKFNVFYLS